MFSRCTQGVARKSSTIDRHTQIFGGHSKEHTHTHTHNLAGRCLMGIHFEAKNHQLWQMKTGGLDGRNRIKRIVVVGKRLPMNNLRFIQTFEFRGERRNRGVLVDCTTTPNSLPTGGKELKGEWRTLSLSHWIAQRLLPSSPRFLFNFNTKFASSLSNFCRATKQSTCP